MLEVIKIQYLQIKYNEEICQEMQQFNIKYNSIT